MSKLILKDVFQSIASNEKIRILFAGFGPLGLCLLRALLKSPEVVTIVAVMPASNLRRNRLLKEHPEEIELLRLATENEIRILNAPSINSSQFLVDFDELKPHALLIGSWSEIIKPPTLQTLKGVPIFNCHGSMLPKFRGACPCLATIFNGERHTGLTIHLIDEGIDTGDILLQQKVDVKPDETTIQLDRRISQKFGDAIVPLLLDLKAGKIVSRKQTGEASYVPSPNPEWGWIPWDLPHEIIDRRFRALHGHLPLVTSTKGVVIGFVKGRVVRSADNIQTSSNSSWSLGRTGTRLTSGTVIADTSDKFIVATIDQAWNVELMKPVVVPAHAKEPTIQPGDQFLSLASDSILKSA